MEIKKDYSDIKWKNNGKLKLLIIVGTRPEIIRLSEVIKAIDKYFKLVLVHTGQNYDYTLNQVFFEQFKLRKPDYYLDAPGAHLGETVGNIIAKSYEVIEKEKPDASCDAPSLLGLCLHKESL